MYEWDNWLPNAKEGQLLRLKKNVVVNNRRVYPYYKSLQLHKNDIVMFLSLRQMDCQEMASGPRGEMRHERIDFDVKILCEDKIWHTNIVIIEGSFSEFDMKFEVI